MSVATSFTFCAIAAFRTHPEHANVSLFNLEAVLLLTPGYLGGSFLGTLFHGALPRWLLLAILLVFTVWVLIKVVFRLLAIWKHQRAQQVGTAPPTALATQVLLPFYNRRDYDADGADDDYTDDDRGGVSTDPDAGFWWKATAIVALNAASHTLELARGSRKSIGDVSAFGVDVCSRTYWLLAGAQCLALVAAMFVTAAIFVPLTARRHQAGAFVRGVHVDFTWLRCALYSLVAVLGGFTATMVGTSAPLMLAMFALGLRAEVLVACDALMHLLNSSGVIAGYLTSGFHDYSYIAIVAGLAASGTIVGSLFVWYMVRRGTSAEHATVLSLVAMIAIALYLLVTFGIVDVVHDVKTHQHLKFAWTLCRPQYLD